jgi:hypothetical protein
MMEISLNITDEPVLEIAEVHDTGHYQRREMERVGGKKGTQIRRENLVRKLYEGSLYDPGVTWARKVKSLCSSP